MPASRSRTERWRDCLHQIYERNGGLEISLLRESPASEADHASDPNDTGGPDLVWRVRILRLTDDEIMVERPAAMGHAFTLAKDSAIIAVMSVGQNRWMFRTKVIGSDVVGVKLAMPVQVERCRRRDFLRVSTAELHLPTVSCWPLMNPLSVIPAEIANRAHILELERTGSADPSNEEPEILPEVGPPFRAHLMNLGGGGVGLLVGRDEAQAADRIRMLWMHIDLRPSVPAPIGLTTRLVHKHIDSEQNLYIGAAFDFSHHAPHREFVVSQITRYLASVANRRLAA
jgi:hypothetical protein